MVFGRRREASATTADVVEESLRTEKKTCARRGIALCWPGRERKTVNSKNYYSFFFYRFAALRNSIPRNTQSSRLSINHRCRCAQQRWGISLASYVHSQAGQHVVVIARSFSLRIWLYIIPHLHNSIRKTLKFKHVINTYSRIAHALVRGRGTWHMAHCIDFTEANNESREMRVLIRERQYNNSHFQLNQLRYGVTIDAFNQRRHREWCMLSRATQCTDEHSGKLEYRQTYLLKDIIHDYLILVLAFCTRRL